MVEKMVEKDVTVYPFTRLPGTIMVPEAIADDAKKTEEYVAEHFSAIKLGKPEFDFKGADFLVE